MNRRFLIHQVILVLAFLISWVVCLSDCVLDSAVCDSHHSQKLLDGSSVPVDTELKAIERHIVSCKGAGKRGLPIVKLIGCARKAVEVAQAATSKERKCGAKGSKKIKNSVAY